MAQLFQFVQAYGLIILTIVGGVMFLIMFMNQFRMLRKLRGIQSQIDSVTDAVSGYLSAIMETEEPEKDAVGGVWNSELQEKIRRDEEKTQIISSVLQEIFP